MADTEKYDDEYTFVDPDAGSMEPLDYQPKAEETPHASNPQSEQSFMDKTFAGKSGVIRNALIVVGVIIVVMIIYPFVHSSSTVKKSPPAISTAIQEPVAPKYMAPATPQVVSAPAPDLNATRQLNDNVTQKLSALESSQERMQNEVASTNSQLSGINNNINDMMAKVTEMNNIMTAYAAKAEEQSRVIAHLTAEAAALKKAHEHRVAKRKVTMPRVKYYIQAIIPGRAWLLASNGATMTVREGTMIAGLGMVRLIDPRQGRVVISSGQVIRFSQEDS